MKIATKQKQKTTHHFLNANPSLTFDPSSLLGLELEHLVEHRIASGVNCDMDHKHF